MTPAHIKDAFAYQSAACASLGSPFMGNLMQLCADMPWPDGVVTDRVFGWQGDISPRGQSVPLRLAGALHALHLRGHAVLGAVYPPHDATDKTLWDAVSATLVTDAQFIDAWLDSAPQTNEVRRSATLIAVGHVLTERFGLPIRTSELGASGGLNLHWDSYAMDLNGVHLGNADPVLTLQPQWSGPLPPSTKITVAARSGVDLNPLNPANAEDALRLQAYLWPDQPERIALTRAAIASAKTRVAKADAIDWLAGQLDHQAGQTHLIYSTVAWQYFPAEKQGLGEKLITAAGATATEETPVAWFGMENDGEARGAALILRLWPGDHRFDLGRADFHGRWIEWRGLA